MKTGARLNRITVEQAQTNLEQAAAALVRKAVWYSPYNCAGRRYHAHINELRRPLVELKLARRASLQKAM